MARSAACWICSTFWRAGAGKIRGNFGQPVGQHFGVAFDHHQQVVEIVGDAAGEFADRLQFRGLAELVGEMLAVGNVEGDANDAEQFAFATVKGLDVRFEDKLLPFEFVGYGFAGQRLAVREDRT